MISVEDVYRTKEIGRSSVIAKNVGKLVDACNCLSEDLIITCYDSTTENFRESIYFQILCMTIAIKMHYAKGYALTCIVNVRYIHMPIAVKFMELRPDYLEFNLTYITSRYAAIFMAIIRQHFTRVNRLSLGDAYEKRLIVPDYYVFAGRQLKLMSVCEIEDLSIYNYNFLGTTSTVMPHVKVLRIGGLTVNVNPVEMNVIMSLFPNLEKLYVRNTILWKLMMLKKNVKELYLYRTAVVISHPEHVKTIKNIINDKTTHIMDSDSYYSCLYDMSIEMIAQSNDAVDLQILADSITNEDVDEEVPLSPPAPPSETEEDSLYDTKLNYVRFLTIRCIMLLNEKFDRFDKNGELFDRCTIDGYDRDKAKLSAYFDEYTDIFKGRILNIIPRKEDTQDIAVTVKKLLVS